MTDNSTVVIPNLTGIYVSNDEAELFKLFCLYHDLFLKLVNRKVFDVKNGNVKLFFDRYGNLNEIRIEHTYR